MALPFLVMGEPGAMLWPPGYTNGVNNNASARMRLRATRLSGRCRRNTH
ncbi:hypothetical protein [Saliniramus sp.]|nr:hypothetical protein [Saliniramus sp.]HMB11866.1 hypothetical protein [Saliniramus sp.]